MQVELSVQDCFYDSSQLEVLKSELHYNYTENALTTETWENWLHRWLLSLQDDIPSAATYELCLRLTDDAEIQALNAQYRHQNKPTDVLAFAALEVECPQSFERRSRILPLYLGDIVISVETAQRQAQQQGHNLPTELAWLAAHGLLHLLGWDHPDEDSLLQMLEKQVMLLQIIGLTISSA